MKGILRQRGYLPDKQEKAKQTVLKQPWLRQFTRLRNPRVNAIGHRLRATPFS